VKVMVVGPLNREDTFAENVARSLRRTGHEAITAGPVRPSVGKGRLANAVDVAADRVAALDILHQSKLVAEAKRLRPELIVSVDARMRPQVVSQLRDVGEVVLWFPDHVANLGRHEMFLAPYSTIYFKNPNLVNQLKGIHGLPVRYLPEAADCERHVPSVVYGTEERVVVAGHLHPTRVRLLERLIADGIPISIYGPPLPGWISSPSVKAAHTGRYITGLEKARVFRSARAVLNNLHPAEFAGANCRLFEAAGSGALVMTEWRDGMDELFVADKEVVAFDNYGSLLERFRAALGSADFGRSVADAAATRVARDHTYEKRLAVLLGEEARWSVRP